ncbi:MAG: diguanylate cyclase [Gammaproteobacteria bacterium]|nr:diguanylate cyclase [Gammaproteobacteria bacterium]
MPPLLPTLYRAWLTISVLLMLSLPVRAEDPITADGSFEAQLQQADRLRTDDSVRAQQIIDELKLRLTEADGNQRYRLATLDAHLLLLRGEFEQGRARLSELAEHEVPAELKARVLYLLTRVADISGDFEQMFTYLQRATDLLPQLGQSIARRDILALTASSLGTVGATELAMHYGQEALSLAQELDDASEICFSYDTLAVVALIGERWPEVEHYYQQARHACNGVNSLIYASAHDGAGYVAHHKGQLKEALAWFEQSMQLRVNGTYPFGELQTLASIAQLQVELGMPDMAEATLNKLWSSASKLPESDLGADVFKTAAALAEAQGQWQQALRYHRQHVAARKQELDRDKAMRLAFLQVQQQVAINSQLLKETQQENSALSQLRQQLERQQRVLIGVLVLLALGLAFVAVLLRRMQGQQRKLHELAAIDPLTGIANRRQAFKLAERLLASCQRRGAPFATIMLDLDHFKAVNDRYGHAIGDQLLCHAAQALERAVRRQDVVGRAGGEEFVIFLPDTGLDAAALVAERCRLAITVEATERNISCTASLGLAVASYGLHSLDQLMAQADAALYRAKQQGRNRVVTAPLPIVSTAATV